MTRAVRWKPDFKAGIQNDGVDFDLDDVRHGNWGPLKRWFATLGSREQEENRAVFLGDSVVVGGFSTTFESRFVNIWAEAQQTTYRPNGSGWFGVSNWLTPWVGVGHTTTEGFGIGHYAWLLAGTDTATITIPSCDRFQLYFTGGANTASAEIRVNGTLVSTFSTTSGTLANKVFDSGLLDMGPKTVEVKSNHATNNVILSGGYFWNGDFGKGTHVYDIGHSGYTIDDICDKWLGRIAPTETSMALSGEFLSPDLVALLVGINDEAAGTPEATFKADMGYAVDQIRALTSALDPSVVIISMWARGDGSYTDAQWQPYRRAMREVAQEKGCVFIDLYELGGWIGETGPTYHTGCTVNTGTVNFTVPTGGLRQLDVGATVTGDGITTSRTIATVTGPTTGTLSAVPNSSFAGTAKLTIVRKDPNLLTTDGIHPSDRGMRWIADELNRVLVSAATATTAKIGVPFTRHKSADQTVSSVTVIDDLHLWTYLTSGYEYNIELGLWLLPAATTTGPRIAFAGPAMTSFKSNLQGPTGATTYQQISAVALATELTLASLPSATIPTLVNVNLHVRPSASGYLKLRIGSEVAAANITYQRGCWMRTTRVL